MKIRLRKKSPAASSPAAEGGDWLVPGEQAWEVRSLQPPAENTVKRTLGDIADEKPPEVALVALPPQFVICQLFWLETTDEKAASDLLRMQCERRSLLPRDEVWAFRIVRREAGRLLAQVLILQNALPGGIEAEGRARFEAWPRCLELPPRAVCLWRTLGFITLALTDEQGVAYFQSLPHQSFTRECLHDVQAALWMATAQHWVPEPESLHLPGVWKSSEIAPLESLGLPVRAAGAFRLAAPVEPLEITPRGVRLLRAKRRRQFRARLVALVLGALYAAFLLFHIATGIMTNLSNARLEKHRDALLPEMTRLQQTARRMDALAPALDTKTYPLEILRRIMAVLPESGVRLTRFEINGNRLELAGESTTAREAFDFLQAIQSSDALRHIEWENPPPPTPLPNDTTRFSIQGTIAGAYHHAEEP